jgi:GTP-binding protein EngB required for normal cell division
MSGSQSTRLRLTSVDARPALGARKLLSSQGFDDEVRAIDRLLRGSTEPPTVVVVGEIKRGKSTLVNALAGADVSPTGEGVVTSSTVAVVPPSASLPAGSADVQYADRHEVVTLEQAQSLVAPDLAGRERPLGVQVALTSPWVPELALVDTPGVGGLSSVHGRVARRAAAKATALLFVVDGGQTLTAPELEFLRDISDHTEHVVVALTKVDRNPGGWQQVRDENRALLRQHAPRFASVPILPVSASYAVHARSQPPQVAAALEEASGLGALATTLTALLADERRAAVANALRAGHSGLERLEARVALELRASAEVQVREELAAELQRLAQLQLQQRRGKLDLERDLGRIRQSAVELVNERADELTARMSHRIQKDRRGMTAAAKEVFSSELAAELGMLAADVRLHVGARLTTLVEEAFGSLDAVPETSGRVTAELADARTRVRTREKVTMSPLVDPSIAGTVFMGSHLAGFAGLAGPIGLLIGGGAMLAVTMLHRSARQGQQELAGTLYDSIAGARQDLVAAVDSWLRELRPELHVALEDHVAQSLTAVRAVLNEAQRVAKEDEAVRASARRRLELRLQAVQARRQAVEARLVELSGREHSVRTTPPTSTRQRSTP